MSGLTFAQLRRANVERLPLFKNARGGPAHSQPDGSDWALSAWSNAVAGEVGEAANLIKKIERGDYVPGDPDVRQALARELADVAIYLDLLAFRAGIDLGQAIVSKWNLVSLRIGIDLRLPQPRGCAACDRGDFQLGHADWCDHKGRPEVHS